MVHGAAGVHTSSILSTHHPHIMKNRSVLIIGANGRLGLAAAQAFAASGWRVLAQTRKPFVEAMPAQVERIEAGLDQLDALQRAAAGVAVVVYAVSPLYTDWSRVLPMARAGMDLAQRLNATFMLPGSVYNYGEGMPPLLKPDTPQKPTTEKGRIRCALEDEIAARTKEGLRAIVLRAGDFFGGGPGDWIDLMIAKSLRSGKLAYPGPLDVPHAWTYLPDYARCFVILAERLDKMPAFARFHFPGHTVTGQVMLDAIERAASELYGPRQRPMHRVGMPWWALRVMGWAVPMWRELAKMSYLWRVPHALDGGSLSRAVGSVPATPLAVAVKATLMRDSEPVTRTSGQTSSAR